MSEKILVTQALDERDLLVKRIKSKIKNANFVDIIKPNNNTAFNSRLSKDEFSKTAEADYQQIIDLIKRYETIDAAIVASNASTKIVTTYGTCTVAAAISMRARLKGENTKGETQDRNFEGMLQEQMEHAVKNNTSKAENRNIELRVTAENMRTSILGKDTKVRSDNPLEVVDVYVRENTTELLDPINVIKKIEELKDKRLKLLSELDTQIKVSNATTCIEI